MITMPTALIVLGLVLAAAMLLWATGSSLPNVTRNVRRSFWCPFVGRNVTTEFEEERWDGAPFEVTRCSIFDPPTAIECDRLCLRLPESFATAKPAA